MTTTASHNLVGAIVRYTGTLTDLRGECLVLGIRNESRAMCIVTLDPDKPNAPIYCRRQSVTPVTAFNEYGLREDGWGAHIVEALAEIKNIAALNERFSFLEGDNQPYSERDWFWCIQPGCTVPYHC